MEEDLSLSLELGGCFTKRKREKFSEEEMINNRGGGKKIGKEKNTEDPLLMNLNLPSVQSEMKDKKTESFQDRFAQSMVEVNNRATPANSTSSQHSMAPSLQGQPSIKHKTKENQGNIADSHVAAISDIAAMNEEENSHARKKLRLSKEQAMLLEENFREHATLNPKLKLALAKQLSLQPRQVEVWFQNRRARTKLKQTEIDCKYLKHRYQILSQENYQLKREVAELRALKLAYATHPFYKNVAATGGGGLPFCSSCQHNSTYFSDATNSKPALFASILSKPRI